MLLGSCPLINAQGGDSDFDVKVLAKNIEERLEACPRREVIRESDHKHHRWQKTAWGPPSDVIADVKPNDSLIYPYILTIEFSLSWGFGPERDSKAEAEKDMKLSHFVVDPEKVTPQNYKLAMALQRAGKNRNVYLVGKDGIRLKAIQVLAQNLDGTPGTWEDRPSWPDACWDHIAVKQGAD